jgi:hypothetical protein
MALEHVKRSRVPLDGRWFRTTAGLQSIMRAAARYDDEMNWPGFVENTRVPIWVRMVPHQGQPTPTNPEAIYHHPIVKVGEFQGSTEVELDSGYSAGLTRDSNLDGWDNDHKWIYRVFEGDAPLGEDASIYVCDQCNESLYRDDDGVRHSHSACLHDGSLVCRDCDCLGLIVPGDSVARLARVRKLADFIGPKCRDHFERQLGVLGRTESWGHPSQTRLMLDCKWSFFWSERLKVDGKWKRGMHGGLIQHGPSPHMDDDGNFTFTAWDYQANQQRPATEAEINNISWSLHT